MRAILTTTLGKAEIVEVPEPDLQPDSILIRPHYVGNNPCDYYITDVEPMFTQNQVVGCDYMGVVEKVGSDAKTSLKPGDKVCGVVAAGAGCDVTRGAFADLLPAYGDFCFPLPKGISEPQAAALGVGISTIAVSFYQDFGLPLPDDDPKSGEGKTFFVYAGSTATGLLAIQFAKLSGFRVITTCSSKNFGLVKKRGADEAYDYHNFGKCVQDIKASVGHELEYAYVCVGGEDPPKVSTSPKSLLTFQFRLHAGSFAPKSSPAKVANSQP